MPLILLSSLPLVLSAQGIPATKTCSDGSVILASDRCPSAPVANEWGLVERTKSWEILRSSQGNGCQLRLLEKASAQYFTGTQPSAWIQAMRNRSPELWIGTNPAPASKTTFISSIYAGKGVERSFVFNRRVTSFGRTNSTDVVATIDDKVLYQLADGPGLTVYFNGKYLKYNLPESARALRSFTTCVAKG